MASTTPQDVYNTILRFGDYYRRRYLLETNPRRSACETLSAQDIAYYERIVHCSDLPTAFEDHLNLDLGFYHGVRDQIASISRVWDAVLAEKVRYDAEGWPSMNRQFMESFLLCLQILPGQIKTGYLGPSLLRSASNTPANLDGLPIILEETAKNDSQTSSRPVSAFSLGDFPEFESQAEDLFHSVFTTQDSQQQPPSDFQGDAASRVTALEQAPIQSEIISTATNVGHDDIEEYHRNSGFRVHMPGVGQSDDFIWTGRKAATLDPRELFLGDLGSPAGGWENDLFDPRSPHKESAHQLQLDGLLQTSSTKQSDTTKPPSDSTTQDSAIQRLPPKRKTSKPKCPVLRKRKVAEIEDIEETVTAAPPAKRQGRSRGRPRRSEALNL
ncbi:hypothetical protein NPX13_g11048 [Xylaria arbuscula]|uniref:Uncharacterized protein n=1 Tax=Xylaria arbuscula TaxID=114810 RepID=A0A9W8N3M2_9PEZI|nr:hypothetical protein NPX13_g11048 [Xylaria arbuscula]